MNILSNFQGNNINRTVNTRNINTLQNQKTSTLSQKGDVFVKNKSANEIFADKLFGPGGLEKEYYSMAKSLGLKHIPAFSVDITPEDVKAGRGGAYNFANNEIRFDISQYNQENLEKIYIKLNNNNKEYVMPFSIPKTPIAIISSKSNCENFIKNNPQLKLFSKPATKEDIKKSILQSLYHKLVHAQQHELMARTEGIGVKRIINEKGLGRLSLSDVKNPERLKYVQDKYDNSPWKNYNDVEGTIKKDSPEGKLAYKLLEANYNYIGNPNIGVEYYENLLEKDAYSRASKYIIQRFGSL